jgi:hypothetical protein
MASWLIAAVGVVYLVTAIDLIREGLRRELERRERERAKSPRGRK